MEMTDDIQSFETNLPQVSSEEALVSSSTGSDSDDDVPMLQNMSLEGFDTFSEPVTGTGFIYHDKMAEHKCEWDENYPENPQRLIQPFLRCNELGLVQRCQRLPIRYATEDEIILKHTRDHVEIAQSTTKMTLQELMALCETYDAWFANKVTYEASLIAAGSTISMVEHILHDKLSNGFAMVRPPGHHAMEQEFNGYCTFNNVALAAQFALNSGTERILIVDWDVHHGQGTQRMFYEDPRVLYFSIHRYEHGKFWPNLRESDYDYIGKGPGEGFNINIPLNNTGMTDSDYMAVFNMVLLPVAYEFQPQLILISSGYDAAVGCPEFCPQLVIVSNGLDSAIGDEKGQMLVTPAMYAQMTHQLLGLAAGRVCVVLEGGYCIKSLAEGCALTLRSLLRDPCPMLPPFKEPCDSMMTTILNVIKVLRKYWNCFRHFETLDRSEVCQFEDVNNMPPVPDVTFSTPENRPEKFQIVNCYPLQEEKTRVYFADLINRLIAEANLAAAEYKCCYVFDAEMRSHRNLHDKSHPERPERISKIYSLMAEWKLLTKCLTVASRLARKSELLWIHEEGYLNDLLSSQSKADDELKDFPNQHRYSSTYFHQKSVHCALLSCGSLLNVVEAVLRAKAQSGVAIVRPPGHHAESKKAMGFCFFNNVAVAAKFAQEHFGLKRILIVDWDVHHGNATQHQFYSDPSVLYISLHRYDNGHFFPSNSDGDMKCVGSGPGKGYNVNIPWSNAKMGDAEYIAAFTQIVMPISYQFAPELVLVSAGFDCAVGDPLGGYHVTPACFGHMTHMLMGLANGKVVLSLEGGYNLNSISYSMATCMAALLGYPCPSLGKLAPNERAAEIIHDVLEIQKNYWTSLKGNVRIPSVRKLDNDVWVNEAQGMRTRRSGGSKVIPGEIKRPRSAGSAGAPRKTIVFSASEASVATSSGTITTTGDALTTETETHLTLETSGTFRSSSQSTKGATESLLTSEQTTTHTTTETHTSTSDISSSSVSDRNDSNLNAGAASAEDKEKNVLPEIKEISFPQQPEDITRDAEMIMEKSTEVSQQGDQESASRTEKELISGLQNLALSDSQIGDTSYYVPSAVSRDVILHEAKVSQSCTYVDGKVSGDQSQKSAPYSAPASVSVSAVDASKEERITPSDRKPNADNVPDVGQDKSDFPKESGDASGTKPKLNDLLGESKPIFRSLIYGDEPDPEPLSIFASNHLMASQEQIMIAKEKSRLQTKIDCRNTGTTEKTVEISSDHTMSNDENGQSAEAAHSHGNQPGDPSDCHSRAPGASHGAEEGSELLGACGGSSRPITVQDLIRLQGVEEMHAVQPLTWCPHLTEVRPLPQSGFSVHAPCATCGDVSENWVCLTCYTVECSRFVNEHMLMHRLETGHNLVLSYTDLSVWCYGCDHYVDNDVLFPVKNAAHEMKFGESLMHIP